MSVTADQIEAVAEHAEAVHLVGAAQQLRGRAAHVRLVESQPAEVVELAAAIRNAYYNDGVRRELLSSRDPGQWLRMAVEAKSALGVGAVAPRVFNVGDPEPEDRDLITLRGVALQNSWQFVEGEEALLKFGDYSKFGYGGEKGRWCQVTKPKTTYGEWDYWLEHFGPLTEVLDEPKPQPRTFEWGDDEPDNITHVRDDEGDVFKRTSPNKWALRSSRGTYGDPIFTWGEVTLNDATEAFGDLG
ncbi:hypothetical protein [Rhodococcus erythropolis]|uniref:hypothetical protein n=1 Tax=Rhodococcus erythropolis TaxID=1833 RepID=UPI001BEBE85A|nr:hypothetical protein [Rhodococcus erythropolis]MBT2266400.1 hypothetical protein [Rhodococcus erythropolis]